MRKKTAIKLLEKVIDKCSFIKEKDGSYTWSVSFSKKINDEKEIKAIKELAK